MFKPTKILTVVTLILSAFTFQASAELVKTHWKTTGDTKATLDTDTGLEWLDLRETVGKSYNTALSDSAYEGWRMPTMDEVITLMYNIFPNVDFLKTETEVRGGVGVELSSNSIYYGSSLDYVSFLGHTYSNYSRGYYTNGTEGYRVDVRHHCQRGRCSGRIRINLGQGALASTTNYADYQVGMFMVSDGGTTLSSQQDPTLNANNAAAPINNVSAASPAALSLLGLSLMGLSFRRREK